MEIIDMSDCDAVAGGAAPWSEEYVIWNRAYFGRGAYGIESAVDGNGWTADFWGDMGLD